MQAKWLYQLMGQPLREESLPDDVGLDPATREDEQYLRLRLKKKRQTQLLRKMLEEGGYSDLARMTNVSGGRPVYSEPGEVE